jgi:diguanylate cyclase (GGDEF)-like protein
MKSLSSLPHPDNWRTQHMPEPTAPLANSFPLRCSAVLTLLFLFALLLPSSPIFPSQASYIPVHTGLELIVMVVSAMVFSLGWNLRRRPSAGAEVLLGIAALGVLLTEMAHTLSYPGMPDLVSPNSAEKAINFWLVARLMAAASLLAVALRPVWTWSLSTCYKALGACLALVVVIWWSGLLHAEWWPRTFSPELGLSTFKIVSEYVLVGLYMAAALGFYWGQRIAGTEKSLWLGAASWTLGLAELFFTLYQNVTDLFNLLGHMYLAIGYVMIYRGVYVVGVEAPLRALREREFLFSSLYANMLNGCAYCRMVYEQDQPVDFVYLSVNPAFEQQTGLRNVVGHGVCELIPGIRTAVPELFEIYGRVARSGAPESKEIFVPGLEQWFAIAAYCPTPGHFVSVFDVITERKNQQARIERLMRVYAVLSSINSTIVRIHDRQALLEKSCSIAVEMGRFTLAWVGMLRQDGAALHPIASCGADLSTIADIPVSDSIDTPYGPQQALTSQQAVICNNVAQLPHLDQVYAEALKLGAPSVCTLPLVVDERSIGVLALHASEVDFFDADERKLLEELAADISFALQYIEREERINYLAYYDDLTGLPNRTLFLDRVGQILCCTDGEKEMAAVFLLDLDRFTRVNESYGRHTGDLLLKLVAARLRAALPESYTLARLGSDRFAIAVSNLRHSGEAAVALNEQLFTALAEPFALEGMNLRLSAHAGIALYPDDGKNAITLLQCAESALREARAEGARSRYYAPDINARVAARLQLESELHHALDAGEFVMHYQPRVDLGNGHIAGAEALIRWQHPIRGLLMPAAFIAAAEETGAIIPIGAWAIDAVCSQQAAWLAAGLDIVPVSINLSSVQFLSEQLLPELVAALARHGIPAKHIELELTESVVMRNPEEAAKTMKGFRDCGLRLSLDDFGTGYSSLAYLRQFPFDFVKIDRTFIRDITCSPDDAAIATAVIAMAHRLNLKVVAEGVESEGQMRYLRKHDCDQVQGYFFSRPVPAEAFGDMLREARCLPIRSPAEQAESRTVLLVDDDPGTLSALKRLLQREGYRVLTAGSAQEGLDLLATNEVQVIVSDQRMAGISGSEFLGIVKELHPDTVRIILSGYTDLQVIMDAVNRGAVYKLLTKPWDDEQLKEQIRDAFLRYRPLAKKPV